MNELQTKAKSSILSVFPNINFTLIGPEGEESYYSEVEGFKIYLDDLGLQIFLGDKEEIRWEIYEFDSEDQMVAAFTAELEKRLTR